jgi:phenylpyruvate tautomerase PptA (4-oxalocrotonate tautomerase family)
MPVVFIEGLPGLQTEAKKRMIAKITAAIDEAYHLGDTLIFVREYPAHQAAWNGQLQSENPKILEALKKVQSRSGASRTLSSCATDLAHLMPMT